MSDILLRTLHGSRLYNLSYENSDYDYYTVYSGKGRAKQTIVDGVDTLTISYDSFMHQCYKGVPQALEALFSTQKEIDKIPFIASSFSPGPEVYKTYMRTIRNFWKTGEFKRMRHASRLCLNLSAILDRGRFNPSLSPIEQLYVTALAESKAVECPSIRMSGLDYTW